MNLPKRTLVAILLDSSSSMYRLKKEAISSFNSMLNTIKVRSAEENQETLLALLTFADSVRVVVQPTDVSRVKAITDANYEPHGNTAMFDCVGKAVKLLSQESTRADDSFLILCITDGEENASLAYNKRTINQLIQEMEATDRWTFAFQVPKGYGPALVRGFNISPDNVREWETSARGLEEAAIQSNTGLSNYFTARTAGQGSTKKFYMTTDLSQVSTATVARTLQDLSHEFKLLEVRAEAKIKEFVEEKMQRPYKTGTAFYLLMKSEKIQPQKEVLLMEKGKSAVYGGAHARELIGLPHGQHANVKPGNHSNYDIFVQSTSTNRILPRGTKVLVRS